MQIAIEYDIQIDMDISLPTIQLFISFTKAMVQTINVATPSITDIVKENLLGAFWKKFPMSHSSQKINLFSLRHSKILFKLVTQLF